MRRSINKHFLTETAGSATGNWLSARNSPSNEVTGGERRAASISWSATDNPNNELIWAGARREGVGGGIPDIVLYRVQCRGYFPLKRISDCGSQ